MTPSAETTAEKSSLIAKLYLWLIHSVADIGAVALNWITSVGSVFFFAMQTISWLITRVPKKETLLPNFYQVGVRSLPVVALTGTFIGMVLAVQSYSQFAHIGLQTRLGGVINMSLVTELGPVLAGTMLAGRVGSAMAAELGTMRVTEQIDALASMGANPIQYLVVPRLLACLCLIPALTVVAVFMGVVGGAFYSILFLISMLFITGTTLVLSLDSMTCLAASSKVYFLASRLPYLAVTVDFTVILVPKALDGRQQQHLSMPLWQLLFWIYSLEFYS